MTITEGANELLMGAGGKTAKFPDVGDKVVGTILAAEPGQQTDIDGKSLFWDDGKPRMQVVISLQTDDREEGDADDDGVRKLYVKGQMLKAVQEVVRPHKGLAVGGKLAVQYTGDGEQKTRGYNPPKLYKAQYQPPTSTVNLDGPELF